MRSGDTVPRSRAAGGRAEKGTSGLEVAVLEVAVLEEGLVSEARLGHQVLLSVGPMVPVSICTSSSWLGRTEPQRVPVG